MEPSLDELQFYAERLSNIVSYIEQFKAAIDFLSHERGDVAELKAQIPKLKEERAQLELEKEAVLKELMTAQNNHKDAIEGITASAQATQVALIAKTEAAKKALANAEGEHKMRMADMDQEYGNRLQSLTNQVSEQESRLNEIIESIKVHKDAMARI